MREHDDAPEPGDIRADNETPDPGDIRAEDGTPGPGDIRAEIADADLAERLERDRPIPRAAFRGTLARRLAAHRPRRPRPRRLWLYVTASGGAGALLLLAGALSAAGIGPLAS